MNPSVVCVGPYIVDILLRPVNGIPEGQGGALVDESRIAVGGTGGGTAVDLAKLGAHVTAVGAIGNEAAGRLLRLLLEDHGVDTTQLAVRDDRPTATTVLPIRLNGDRPTLHIPGAIAHLRKEDINWDSVGRADFLHVGGPDVLGDFMVEVVPNLLRHAKRSGAVTTVDVLRNRADPVLLGKLEHAWADVDYFLPNEEQLRALTGTADLEVAARKMRNLGVSSVAVTMGADGSLIISDDGVEHIPAFRCDVVDTTGCGDAYTAGFIIGLDLGWNPSIAARLATAAAALVAQGLGSDAGIIDLRNTISFWRERAEQIGQTPPELAVRLPGGPKSGQIQTRRQSADVRSDTTPRKTSLNGLNALNESEVENGR